MTQKNVSIRGMWWKLITGLLMTALILAVFMVVKPAVGFPYPPGAKIIFFHVPCAWLSCLGYIVAAFFAARYLHGLSAQHANELDDIKSAAAIEIGLLFSVLTTITGSIFSQLEWGLYWNWDIRETSVIILLLIFSAYLVLRSTIQEPDTRARLSAVYALVALVPGMFLIWVLPRVVFSLHGDANQAVVGGHLSGLYRPVLYGLALPANLLLFTWLFQLRVRLAKLER